MVLTADLISRAQAGDGDAFQEVTGPYLRELQVHCYRMLGSFQDGEDALQDTLAAQGDIGPWQQPRFVRVASQMPRTPTFKVLTRVLAADRWHTSDPVWWRPYSRGDPVEYVVLDAEQATSLDAQVRPGPHVRERRR